MAQSDVDCCNSALQKVGAARIMSLGDSSREARSCVVAYDSNRRDELRRHRWKFSIKRVVLAADTVAPSFEYTYRFRIPSDCLRILLPKDPYLDWKLEGRYILTNFASSPSGVSLSGSPVLGLTYISDVTDAASWDASFYSTLAIALALDICEDLTQSNQKKVGLRQDYKDSIGEAKKVDAIEATPSEAPDDDFWLVRL